MNSRSWRELWLSLVSAIDEVEQDLDRVLNGNDKHKR